MVESDDNRWPENAMSIEIGRLIKGEMIVIINQGV